MPFLNILHGFTLTLASVLFSGAYHDPKFYLWLQKRSGLTSRILELYRKQTFTISYMKINWLVMVMALIGLRDIQ